MLKLKYYSLNKDEKEKLKVEFYKTEYGKELGKRLNRLLVIGIIGIVFAIILIIWHKNIWDIVTSILLLIASIIFIISSFRIRIIKLNNYLVKKNKK